jgi:hypothetical protein
MHVTTKVSSSISRNQGLPHPRKTKLLRGCEPQNSSPPTKSKSKSSHRQDWFHKKITCPDQLRSKAKLHNFLLEAPRTVTTCNNPMAIWVVTSDQSWDYSFSNSNQKAASKITCDKNLVSSSTIKFTSEHMRQTLEEDTWDFTVKWRRNPVQPPTQKQIPWTQKHLNFPYSKAGRIMLSTTTIAAAAVAACILTDPCSTIHQILSN